MSFSEIKRLHFIIKVFLTWGLDELIPKRRITLPLRLLRPILVWLPHRHKGEQLGVRIRLALEKLGPVWIKFGQMLSTRRDLFPPHIADQLALLQDQVAPFAGERAKQQIERSLNVPIEQWFDDFDLTPLASASIAQVHSATLKANRSAVIIKVIRPDILPVIKADIKLIYRLAYWIERLLPDGKRLHPVEVVRDYERTLINELNLLREAANAIQLKRNFDHDPMLYIPDVYSDLCSESILVMERIYGIPVANITALKAHNINLKLLAERGVKVFFTQVFRDSFFHADMHPGNIFVRAEQPENPQYIAVDFGIVGSLNKEDKRYLAENFIAFFNRDYRRVAELHVDSGWVPPDTNIEEFESAIRTVCEPIFEKPLAEISFGGVLLSLFNTARHFNMEVQPQLVLLQKTLLYIEGIGRELYPQLDLWKTAKPFLEKWVKDQIGIRAILRTVRNKMPFWLEKLPELPELTYENMRQRKLLQQRVDHLFDEVREARVKKRKSHYLLIVGTVLVFSGTLLLLASPDKLALSVVTLLIGLLAWLLGWFKI